jgi:hypothetical protein
MDHSTQRWRCTILGRVLTHGVAALLVLAACASGPHFWTRPGAGRADFDRDHSVCFKETTIGPGVVCR